MTVQVFNPHFLVFRLRFFKLLGIPTEIIERKRIESREDRRQSLVRCRPKAENPKKRELEGRIVFPEILHQVDRV